MAAGDAGAEGLCQHGPIFRLPPESLKTGTPICIRARTHLRPIFAQILLPLVVHTGSCAMQLINHVYDSVFVRKISQQHATQ